MGKSIFQQVFPGKKNRLINKLSEHFFWDVHPEKLDYRKNKKYIIGRIVEYGREKDEFLMYHLYSKRTLRKIIINMDYLNPPALAYFSTILNVKEERFKCYGKKPWYQRH
jgi:hypothetical protein